LELILNEKLPQAAIEWAGQITDQDRYDAILVDEGQDFQHAWWGVLRASLKPDGEMLLAVDRTQNIYGVKNWCDGDLSDTGLSSTWYEMRHSYRMPEKLIDISASFAKTFLADSDPIVPTPPNRELDWSQDILRWIHCTADQAASGCVQAVRDYLELRDRIVSISDLTIIVDDSRIGIKVVKQLEDELKISCVHTFADRENRSDEEKAVKESRNRKRAFNKGAAKAKVTTIHSFKGPDSSRSSA
jgi:hypothetical protein